MSERKPSPPAIWKNSFFWFGAALFGLSVFGFAAGDQSIRDPGQIKESGLAVFYLIGAVLMVVNGVMTHMQSVKHYEEEHKS